MGQCEPTLEANKGHSPKFGENFLLPHCQMGKTEQFLANLSVLWSCCTGKGTVKRSFASMLIKESSLSLLASFLFYAAIMWPHCKSIMS